MKDKKEVNKIRIKSKFFSRLLILEAAYCSVWYMFFAICISKSKFLFSACLSVLIILPFLLNVYVYRKSIKNQDYIQANNVIIIQILIFFLLFKCFFRGN